MLVLLAMMASAAGTVAIARGGRSSGDDCDSGDDDAACQAASGKGKSAGGK
jgi:hypothetical protein